VQSDVEIVENEQTDAQAKPDPEQQPESDGPSSSDAESVDSSAKEPAPE